MSEEEDDSSKTEEPTGKKLEEARKKGNVVSTRELSHFFGLGAAIFFVMVLGPRLANQTLALLSPFIVRPESFQMDAASVSATLDDVVIQVAKTLGLTLLLTVIAALAPAFIQSKWVFATEHIKPTFNKISPLAGIKRLYSRKALIEFIKNLAKVTLVGVSCVMVVKPYLHDLPGLLDLDSHFALGFASDIARRMLMATCMFLFLLSIVDYVYQRFAFLKSQRMTKQEVKDEYRQQEGDPHVKNKLKQMRRERARKRMMANVPKADVIVTNPTHYAVALKYDSLTMAVPKVVAKGVDEVAARIRELAQEHKVIIVRNPPLARVLYDTTDIDEDIPAQQFQAVAKVISYVYQLKGKRPANRPPGPAYRRPPKRK